MDKPLPTKVIPCPIIEVVAEVIFSRSNDMEPSAVYGKVYDGLKEEYPITEKLPIFQLPEDIRLKDDNFKNKPWYKFSNDNYSVLVGASVVAISANDYPGWTAFSQEIDKIFTIFGQANIVKSMNRIGLRYVDKFDTPIVNEIDIKLSSEIGIDNQREIQIKTALEPREGLNATLNIVNNVTVNLQDKKTDNASILDIDIFWNNEADSCTLHDSKQIFNKAHTYQKELFFKLVKEDFLTKNGFTIEEG